jgi:hypothetical protein
MKIIFSLFFILFVYVNSQATYKFYTNNSCTASTGVASFINNACITGSNFAIKYYCTGNVHGNINYLTSSCSGAGRDNQISTTNVCGAHSNGDFITCGKDVSSTNVVASTVNYGNLACNGTVFSAKYYYAGCYSAGSTTSQKYTCANNSLTITTYTDKICSAGASTNVFGSTCSPRDFYSEKIFCGYVDVENVITPNSSVRNFLNLSLFIVVIILFLQ